MSKGPLVRLAQARTPRRRARPTLLQLVALLAVAGTAVAAEAQSTGHRHPRGTDMPILCGLCPASRESSGTSWQPDVSESHGLRWSFGRWQVSAHGELAIVSSRENGPRGDRASFSTNHVMTSAVRRVGRGTLGVRTMWSFEPTTGARGYPLLLQSGETADGVNGLVDRQHPHDLPMELAVTYARPTGAESAFFLYVAAVGEPALGPPAFVHRASAAVIPVAPISHHWLDSTHITYGVVTAGYVPERRLKFEASLFRGREPDEHRWGFERPSLDSYAIRASINPVPSLALQFSAGHLSSPEQIHPGADVTRVTASAMWGARWSDRLRLDTTLAWGRNQRATVLTIASGALHVVPGRVTQALVAEGTLRAFDRHVVGLRFERAQKDELFTLTDPRHNLLFPVTRLTAGYQVDLLRGRLRRAGLGGSLSWIGVPEALDPEYGTRRVSYLGFLRFETH